jgi:hypothetical protein
MDADRALRHLFAASVALLANWTEAIRFFRI